MASGTSNNQAAVMALLTHQLQTYGSTATPEEASRARNRFTKGYAPLGTSSFSWFSSAGASSSAPRVSPKSTSASAAGDGCPMHADPGQSTSEINPLNQMPTLSQKALSSSQRTRLSTDRVVSSIPRSVGAAAPGASPYDAPAPSACPVPHDARGGAGGGKEAAGGDSNWEYPSAQQFYNALVRKGWSTPEEHVETMVLIHNFLNERAWGEVCQWEKEAGFDAESLSLARFTGRPGELSPRARLFGWAGWALPSIFSDTPPFDRHDWIVRRPTGQEVRYIIDYYSDEGEDEEGGAGGAMGSGGESAEAAKAAAKRRQAAAAAKRGKREEEEEKEEDDDQAEFTLDVRPALDSLGAARLRISRGWKELADGTMW